MAITVRVKVLRPMIGDRRYERGEYRTMTPADAERLASTGAVEIVSKPTREKAVAAAPNNKAQRKAPQNKSK